VEVEMLFATKSERSDHAPTAPAPVAPLVRYRQQVESLRILEARLGREAEQVETQLAPARTALANIRAELGQRLQAGSPMAALKALKAKEADAALALEAATALTNARHKSAEDAGRRLQQAREDLKRAEENTMLLRAQVAAQTARVRMARESIEREEAAVAHRRTLLVQEVHQLEVFTRELVEYVGEESGDS
jgi:chromosome segregation ATPase